MAEVHSALSPLRLQARSASAVGAPVTLCERLFRGQLVLRGDGAREAFARSVEQTLGVALPLVPNSVSGNEARTVLWLGPDEWLLVVTDGEEIEVGRALHAALGEQHFALTDVSDSRTVIGFTGTQAREVLMKGCSLDLHPRAFGPGRCAQTRLARAHMLLHQLDEVPSYDVYVHRSFANYVWRWLEDATPHLASPHQGGR